MKNIDLDEAASILAELDRYKRTHQIKFYSPYEFQKKFHNSIGFKTDKPARQKALMAANQVGKCNSISTYVTTDQGKFKIGDLFGKECNVLTWPNLEPRKVLKWVRKPAEECFRITMKNGEWVEVPKGHLILTDSGFLPFSEVLKHLPESVVGHPPSNSVLGRLIHASGVMNYIRSIRDYLDDCSMDYRLGDARLLSDQEGVQVFAPSPNGVLKHNSILSYAGGLANRCKHILSRSFARLANSYDVNRTSVQFVLPSGQVVSYDVQCMISNIESVQQSSTSERPLKQACEARFHQAEVSASVVPVLEGNKIVSVYSVGVKRLYDMEVEDRHNYIAGGLVHHNTICGSFEVAFHVTGMYPDWWEGKRFSRATEWIVASTTNETTRDRCQKDLFGEPTDDHSIGTGAIPLECIGEKVRKPGVPNAYDSVLVKHISGGWSKISFRAYEQGPKKFMGSRLTGGYWADEEPPGEINSQLVRGLFATDGIGILTFTPEEGITEVVSQFLDNIQEGQCLTRASWDDAPHMTPERREMALAGIPHHEREMRSKGEPMVGSGLIFSVPSSLIEIEPFHIPDHFARINGLDFGFDHPFACAHAAVDRDNDTVYIYDGYRESRALPMIHANAIKKHGEWIPCSWPHDGMKADPQSGKVIADIYRDHGLNMWPVPFTNPPPPGFEEGKGGNGTEAGIFHMLEMMESNRFKVFKTVRYWFEEAGRYHRRMVNGKSVIVPVGDDFISAVRYAVMFRRHAQTKVVRHHKKIVRPGLSNWG